MTGRTKASQVIPQPEIARLGSFPEFNPNPVLELASDGKITYANPAARALFPDLGTRGLQHPYLSGWEEFVIQARQLSDFRRQRETPVGERIYLQSIFYVKVDERYRIYGLDITEQKAIEEELRFSNDELNEQRAFLQAILQQIPVAVGVFDAHSGKLIISNPARDDLWRSSNAATLSFADYEKFHCYHPDGTPYTTEELPLIRTIHTGESIRDETILIKRDDGTQGVILVNSAPVYLAGELIAGINLISDISDRVHADQALKESEERYRALVETSNEGIWVADAGQYTTFVNHQMAEMLGYSPEEMMGRRSVEFMAEESKTQFPAMIDRRRKGIKETTEHKFIRKDGTALWVLSHAVPILDQEGQFAGSFGMLTDITAMKNREKELQGLNRTLRAISASNQAMMHAHSEVEFMREVCRIVVEDCGHAMVWVGFAEDDPDKSIRPVVSAGFEEGYLEKLRLTWADNERGRGPGGTAIRTGKISMCRNMLTDPKFAPWRAEAVRRGYASSIVLPLVASEKAFGELTIYSREVDPYTPDEVNLLSELASDLAYGITMLRLRADQDKAQAALKISEERYRTLFESMTEGFALHEMIFDEVGKPVDYRFLEINPAFESLTGLKREDVIGKLHNDVLAGDDPEWVQIYGQVVLTGEPVHFENYSPVLKQHFDVFSFRPAVNEFAVLFLNITARKEMEIALRKAHDELEERVEERTQELGAINEELLIEIGERQQVEEIVRQNAARSESLSEISRHLSAANMDEKTVIDMVTQMAGSTLGDFCVTWMYKGVVERLEPQAYFHPDAQVLAAGWQLLKASQTALSEVIVQNVMRKGKGELLISFSEADVRHLIDPEFRYLLRSPGVTSCMIAPLHVEGEAIGAITLTREFKNLPYDERDFQFFQSLTDRAALAIANARLFRSLENSLQKEQTLRKQLIQAEKNLALNRMVASVAHEINNPIQTIVNCLYLLRSSLPPEGPEREALDMASSETRRIAGLVQQLRELYRPGQDKIMRPMRVDAVVEEVHRLLLPHLQHHHVAWEAGKIPEGVLFNGIPDQIKQVFLNLSLNAIDAMDPDGGSLTISAALDSTCAEVAISITDSGPGIPTENLDRIFEPFFTTKTSGTGLGLAITFDIVQHHGGRIVVDSLPGEGATFTVWLPTLA